MQESRYSRSRSKLAATCIVTQLMVIGIFGILITCENQGAPVGEEFQVNTYIANNQNSASIALDSSGNFVIVWDSWGQDGDREGVFAKRYASNGSELIPPPGALKGGAQGNEFRVNTMATREQYDPAVAMNSTGSFVVTWTSNLQDSWGYGVFGQRFLDNGTPQGSEFQVNDWPEYEQWHSSVAMNSSGSFVVVWESQLQDGWGQGIYAKRYDSNGFPLTPPPGALQGGEFGHEFRVNSYSAGDQSRPCIAMDAMGNFIITWQGGNGQDGSFIGIFAQCYDYNGNPVGGNFLVNTYILDDQVFPSVAMDSKGNFVIAWESEGQDGNGQGIYAQRYDNTRNRVGDEFRVNVNTIGHQTRPSVAIDSGGNFLITWASPQDGDGSYGIYAHHYDNNGYAFGDVFRVNNYTIGTQQSSHVAMNMKGNITIGWISVDQDGSGYGIFAQRFDNVIPIKISNIQIQDITDTSATIRWESNRPANSTVEYGLSTAYGSFIENDSMVTLHSFNLTGLQPGRLYHFRVGSYHNSSNYNISENLTFTTKYPIYLEPGWNMISLPLNQTDPDLGKMLESISGDYNAVQWYDVTDTVDPWKHNHTSKLSILNDLTDIDKTMGLLIHIINPLGTTLHVNGTAPDIGYINPITLYNGWNLVGYPSLIERAPGSSGLPAEVDLVQWYNASSGSWESWDPGVAPDTLNILKPGQGLWVHHNGVSDVWSLEYVN